MKTWNKPELNELDLSATAYSPDNGTTIDGSYTSTDGQYTYYTYGPSGAAAE